MDFKEIQKLVYEEYLLNEFKQKFEEHGGIGDLAEVGLIASEVGEAEEAIRKQLFENLKEELADIIIRTMNYASRKGINLERAVLEKNKKNLKRGKLHRRVIV